MKTVLAMEAAIKNAKDMQASKKQGEEEIESGEQVHVIQQQRLGWPRECYIGMGTQTTPPTIVDLKGRQMFQL